MGACGAKPSLASELSLHHEAALKSKKTPLVNKHELQARSVKGDAMARGQFIICHPGKIRDFYHIDDKKLGEGTYGSVSRGVHKATGAVRAIKTLAKTQLKNVARFRQEIEIMKMMDHPHIIKLFETFEDKKNIYLVMELCTGGELFDRIIEAKHFKEVEAATVVQHILRAIFYMHGSSICHRDLKPENFLFLTKEPIQNSIVKLIDFGLSTRFDAGQAMTTKAGTPYYVAPQVLSGKYDASCDLWSCGVITYTLLCGYPPFYGRTDQEVLTKVKHGSFTFAPKEWKYISEDAKTLIRKLLKLKPCERYTAQQALNDDWIKLKAPRSKDVSLESCFVQNLRDFRGQNKLKKAALQIIAGQVSESQIRGLRDTFLSMDANGDGLLTFNEMKDGLARAGLEELPSDLQQIIEGMDLDGSGVIDYTEFLAAALDRRSYLQEDVCKTAFSVFDIDGDGKITVEELRHVLEMGHEEEAMSKKNTDQLLRDIDRNGDGTIDFEEFMAMMSEQDRPPLRLPSFPRAASIPHAASNSALSPAHAGGA